VCGSAQEQRKTTSCQRWIFDTARPAFHFFTQKRYGPCFDAINFFGRLLLELSYAAAGSAQGVNNLIQLKPRAEPSEIKRKIQEAFRRNAEIDANRITVEARGGEVILKGTVRSWIEREEAERVAWSAPGVIKVEDRIIVSP
jgi:BON domain